LFHSPHWQDESLRDKTEQWRDQRKKYTTWEIGIWGDEGLEIIGLLYGGVRTHYAFYLADVLANPRIEEGIHFDAGTSCRELFIEPDEWKRVLNELNVSTGVVDVSDQGGSTTEEFEQSNGP
jgi:hypothetical protein